MRAAPVLSALGRRGSSALDRVLYRQKIDPVPVVLQQHRVFVLPTSRGWAIVLTLLLMLVTSMNYALSLGYALTFLVAGLFGASLIHVFRNLVKVQLEPSGKPRAFAGETLSFSFRVTNLARYPRERIRLLSGADVAEVRTLPPGASATASLAIPARERGRRALGRFTVISDHPLGLWRAWGVVRVHYEGVVYPRPETSAPPVPRAGSQAMAPAVRQMASLSEDQELDGLRNYLTGDPVRSIAWKAVARGGAWYTKRMAGQAQPGLAVLRWADTAAGPSDDEARLSRLTAWALRCERDGIAFSLEIPGRRLPLGQGAAHLDATLCALGEFGRPPAHP